MKRQYGVEFRIDAAKLVAEQGYSVPEAGECLGVPSGNIVRWVRQYCQGKLVPGHKQAQRQGGLPVTQPTEQEADPFDPYQIHSPRWPRPRAGPRALGNPVLS